MRGVEPPTSLVELLDNDLVEGGRVQRHQVLTADKDTMRTARLLVVTEESRQLGDVIHWIGQVQNFRLRHRRRYQSRGLVSLSATLRGKS